MPAKKKKVDTEQTLDNLLIALQKSISRVNQLSATVPDNKARAMITGNIDFELGCRCRLIQGDKLELTDDGIEVCLSGQINPDIDTVVKET